MAEQTPPDLQDRLDQFSQRGKSKPRGNSLGVDWGKNHLIKGNCFVQIMSNNCSRKQSFGNRLRTV